MGRVCIWANISSRTFRSTLWLITAIIRAWVKVATMASRYSAAMYRMAFTSPPQSGFAWVSMGVIWSSITRPRKVAAEAVAMALSTTHTSTSSSRSR